MIHLTRLNNRPLVVNADLIKFIENAPDTVITLLTGEKLVVRESLEQVLELVHEFHIHSHRRIAPGVPAECCAPEANSAKPENPPKQDRAQEEKP
jgi:flagellar protein FlbD